MRLGEFKQARILIFFLLLFASVSAAGQPGKIHKYRFSDDLHSSITKGEHSLVIDYLIPEVDLENIFNENGSFFRIFIPGHIPTMETGKPELPVLSKLINIPENHSYKVKISDVRSVKIRPSVRKIEGVVFPAQERETKKLQKKKPFSIDKNLYKTRGIIASDTVTIEPLGKLRSYNLANLTISPVRYNPASNYLEIITSMKIEITLYGPTGIPSKASYPESQLFSEPLSKSVITFSQEDLVTGYSDKPVRMVIVTDTAFLKHLQPFLKWKTQKGYKLEVLTTGAKFAGTTYQEIKSKLSEIYNASSEDNPPPEFLLIIGDVGKVPPYYVNTSSVTDMYYGEFTGDFIPEMYVGRIPAVDTSELKTFVKKIIQYEKFQFADSNKFYSNALITAGYDDSHANYMNGQIKYAIDNYLTVANKINEKHFFYPVSYTSKDSIIKLINKGTSFINYSGHGDPDGWQHINNGGTNPVYGIKVADIPAFKNKDMYPLIISNACQTAEFTNNQSFGNRMVVSADKGAIGFIGCSRDSYWDEDFYWSVGLGAITATPTYATTGFGFYDRLFHTHNERASDWFTSMGQIVHAGNLAVSASTSSYKKWYWEAYNLVGDPSVIPMIGTPSSYSISLPDTLPNKMASLYLNVEPFSYVAVSHFDTLWDASFANPTGSVNLNLPGLSDDSCLIVITGQNRIPLIKTVYFSEITDKYLNINGTGINDSTGNNNDRVDYGETFYFTFNLSNLGLTIADSVSVQISTSSEWITVNTDSVYIGTLDPQSDITVSDGFSLTVSGTVPDMGIIPFDLLVKDNSSEKIYSFDINAHAPRLEIISFKIDDSSGNNNFLADPGEELNLIFNVRNNGTSSASGDFTVSGTSNEITIDDNIKSGILRFDEISEIIVPAKLSADTEIGTIIYLSSILECPPYTVDKSFSFRVGRLRETFESSSFKIFPWINVGPTPWIVTGTDPYEGAVSARSGIIPDGGTSRIMMRTIFTSPDSVRFIYKVSSEVNYDYFSFRLNGIEIFKESGETGWKKKVISVPEGANDMEWIYKKDNNSSGGDDAAWIDQVDFSVSGSLKYIERDLKVARIASPNQKENIGKEIVSVKVMNIGHDTINGFYLAYMNNSRIPVRQFFTNKVYPYQDSITVTFNTPADMSRYGPYNLIVYSYGNSDDYLRNDTLGIMLENTETDEPLLVFPNPFQDYFTIIINTPADDIVQINLVSLKGIKLYNTERTLITGENVINVNSDIAHLPPGLYYLNITGQTIKRRISVLKLRQ